MKMLRWGAIFTKNFNKFRAFVIGILPEKKAAADNHEIGFKGEVNGRITIKEVKADGQVTIETVFDRQPVSEEEGCGSSKGFQIWGRVTRQAVLVVGGLLLLMIFSGTALAFAQPENALASPFKSIAITLTESGYGAVGLIEDVRCVVSGYERNIVSTALQSMKVTEDMDVIPGVSIPTNDMACFPSAECCLFPGYLDSRYSQFRYWIDDEGIVQVDVSAATTDAFLKRTKQLIYRLSEVE